MSKKDFIGEVSSILGTEKQKKGRPVTQNKEITKSSQEGTKPNETRATFIINEDILEKLKGVAYWERKLIKEVINEALNSYINSYEKVNKTKINLIPKKTK